MSIENIADGEALARFQNDVADKTVADDDVHVILEQIVALDVADEIQIQFFAELEGFEREFVALGILRADAQDADARIFLPQNFARINAAHHGELREVQRLAFDVRAGVEQDKFAALARNDGGDAAAIHAGNAPDLERGRRENAAGVAEGNQGVGLASRTSSAARAMEESFFLRSALTGLSSISTTSLAWMTAHAMVAKTAFRQRGVDVRLVADEIKGGDFFVGLQRQLGARDHDPATVVAAHDIHCDSHR